MLKSWAVPKGPSLDPRVKRLARQVEDHPLDYAGFEGVIPAGLYGGGTVMIWDRGTYTAAADVGVSLRRGELELALAGKKLRGGWVLVRMSGRARWGGRDADWLLIKRRGAAAATTSAPASAPDGDVTVAKPCSVDSARSLAQIARDEGGDPARAASGDPPTAGRCRRRAGAAAGRGRSSSRRRAASASAGIS